MTCWLTGTASTPLDAPPGSAKAKTQAPKGLTKQDRNAPKFPDLVKRDFAAAAPNLKWCGDITEIPTDEGKP